MTKRWQQTIYLLQPGKVKGKNGILNAFKQNEHTLQAGIDKPHRNQVMAVEITCSPPTDRRQPFFLDCLQWIKQHMPNALLTFMFIWMSALAHTHVLILSLMGSTLPHRN